MVYVDGARAIFSTIGGRASMATRKVRLLFANSADVFHFICSLSKAETNLFKARFISILVRRLQCARAPWVAWFGSLEGGHSGLWPQFCALLAKDSRLALLRAPNDKC
jgi:hypothetical protein